MIKATKKFITLTSIVTIILPLLYAAAIFHWPPTVKATSFYVDIGIIFILSCHTYYRLVAGGFLFRKHAIELLAALICQSVAFILVFGKIYRNGAIEGMDGIISKADAMYFSIVTWTTLGYGDFRPTADFRLFAAVEALLGYIYLGMIVGVIVGILNNQFSQGKTQKNHPHHKKHDD